MSILSRLFSRQKPLCEDDLVKPYCLKAKQAIMEDDLPKAIAYLDRAIGIAPEMLNLYLQRAQIFQYGQNKCSLALQDYRFILRMLESNPDDGLASKCKQGMKDMMALEPETKSQN